MSSYAETGHFACFIGRERGIARLSSKVTSNYETLVARVVLWSTFQLEARIRMSSVDFVARS